MAQDFTDDTERSENRRLLLEQLRQSAPEFLPGEENALRLIQVLAEEYGYGNLISFLRHQWGKSLMRNNPLIHWDDVAEITNVSPDPESYDRLGDPAKFK